MTQSILLYSRQQRSRDNWQPRNVRQTALSQSKSSRNCKFFDKGDYDLRAFPVAWATLLFRVVIPRANHWVILLLWEVLIVYFYINFCIDTLWFRSSIFIGFYANMYFVLNSHWHMQFLGVQYDDGYLAKKFCTLAFLQLFCLWLSEDHQFLSANLLLLVNYDLCSFLVVGPYTRLVLTTKCC